MAQNITIMGASYTDVPAVTLPKTGGGTARFNDTSGTTVAAAHLETGYTAIDSDGNLITGTMSGGGGGGGSSASLSDPVRFFDYDGTLLHSYSAADFQALTALPDNPSHTGLTAQGWNWTLADAKAQVQSVGACDIGQKYITDDGKTRIYVHMEQGRLEPYLGICPKGTVTVDWGDGSATETLTGTGLTTVKNTQKHVYAAGDYVITLTPATGTEFAFFGTSSGTHLLKKAASLSANVNRVYSSCVRKIEMGTGARIGNNAFYGCYSLASISIPDGVTSIGSSAFYYCSALASISIPDGVTSIGNSAFQYCYALASASIPDGVTSIGSGMFYYCYSLASVSILDGVTSIGSGMFGYCYALASISIPDGVTSIATNAFNYCFALASASIPDGVTSIGNNAFSNCHALASISIPDGVTSIGSSAFASCYGLGEIHFKPTTPPTVSNKNAWTSIPTDCKIYVPAGSLSAYTGASNYPSSSTYTYIEE